MNRLQKNLLATCIATTALSMQTAQASTSAQVTIDWDSFNIEYVDLSGGSNAPSLTWTYQSGDVYSEATTISPYAYQYEHQSAYDFTSNLSTNTTTAAAQSSSLRDNSTSQANSASQSGVATTAGINSAYAQSYNTGNFELTGKGLAIISVNWSLSLTGALGDVNDYSYAIATFSGDFHDGIWNSGSSYSNPYFHSYNTGDFSTNGTFAFAVLSDGVNTVNGSMTGYAHTYSWSPVSQVPVPAAVWMFGSGLLGLIGASRRKSLAA